MTIQFAIVDYQFGKRYLNVQSLVVFANLIATLRSSLDWLDIENMKIDICALGSAVLHWCCSQLWWTMQTLATNG